MTWTFIWLMLLLKIPIGGLLWIVWWAIHKTDEPVVGGDEDGGSKVRGPSHPRAPRPHRPYAPRRGPHAGARPAAPPRTRGVVARARRVEH
ncbi:MAG TPA: hypothetical protein VNC12_02930 [Solirubrobacteraceae bacterium]|nr:hypothetical protein [Solirubrobacteraceae bacterium]